MRDLDYNVFYACRSELPTDVPYFSASPSVGFTASPVGFDTTFSVSLAAARVGYVYEIAEGSHLFHARLVRKTATVLSLVPIFSDADSNTAFATATYTTAATVKVVGQPHVTLPIDLREAPPGNPGEKYSYLVLGSAAVTCDTVDQEVTAEIRTSAPSGDPWAGTDRATALLTVGNASNVDRWPWNCAMLLSDVKPGSLLEHSLMVRPTGSSGTARMQFGRLAAIRIREKYSAGNGRANSISASNSTLVTDANHSFDLPNEDPAGSTYDPGFLIVATGVASNASGSDVRVVVDVVGGTTVTLLDTTLTPRNTTDRMSFGVIALVRPITPNAGVAPKVSIKVASPTSGTATIRRAFVGAFRFHHLVYVPNSSIPFEDLFTVLKSGDVTGTAGTTFVSTAGTEESPSPTGLISQANLKAVLPDWHTHRMEFICGDFRSAGNGRWEVRPAWGSHRVPQPSAHGLWGPSRRAAGFFMHRVPATACDPDNSFRHNRIENRKVVNDGNAAIIKDARYLRLQEITPPRETADSDVELLVDVESGLHRQDWVQVSGDLYKIDCGSGAGRGDLDDVARVIVNGVELTEVYKRPILASTWHFNPEKEGLGAIDTTLNSDVTFGGLGQSTAFSLVSTSNVALGRMVVFEDSATGNIAHVRIYSTTTGAIENVYPGDKGMKFAAATTTVRAVEGHYLYVWMPAGKSPYPQTSDQRVVIVAREKVARRPIDIADYRGRVTPYVPRISRAPAIQEDLDVRVSGSRVQSQFGSLDLANGDGKYDDYGRRLWEGLPQTVRRVVWDHRMATVAGVAVWLARDRVEFVEEIARGFATLPDIGPRALSIGLFPRGVNLARPLTAVRNTVFGGSANEQARRAQGFPVIYGPADRVIGHRITRRTGASDINQYRVSATMLKQVRAAYLSETTHSTISVAGPSNNATLLLKGIVSVNNDQNGGAPADTLYFDVDGITEDGTASGALIENHGAILRHMLLNFPLVPDATVAGSTTLTADHQPAPNTNNVLAVTSNAAAYEGARVRVRDSAVAGRQYHGHVTTLISTNGISVWPALEPGDTVDGVATYPTATTVIEFLEPAPLALAESDLETEAMRLLDRVWRCQSTSKGGILFPVPGLAQRIAYVFPPEMTAQQATEEIGRCSYSAPHVNRQSRVSVVVPDDDADNLLPNGGAEEDRTSADGTAGVRPWTAAAGADPAGMGAPTIEIESSGPAFGGTRCMRLVSPAAAGSGEVSLTGYAYALPFPCPTPGWYSFVIYAMNDTAIADPADFAIAVVKPGVGVETVLKSYVVGTDVFTNRWQRLEVLFQVPPGNVGTCIVKLYPTAIGSEASAALNSGEILLEPDRLSLADATAISELPNAGTDVSSFNQFTAARQPTFRTNVFNGKPVFRFDGGDVLDHQATLGVGSSINFGKDQDIVFAAKFSTTGQQIIVRDDTAVTHVSVDSTLTQLVFRISATQTVVVSWSPGTTNMNVVWIRRRGTSVKMFVNGSLQGSGTLAANLDFFIRYVGGVGSASPAMNGDLGDLWVKSGSNDTLALQMQRRMGERYGITVKPNWRRAAWFLDNWQFRPVAAVLEDWNADFGTIEFEDENNIEARVSYLLRHGSGSAHYAGAQDSDGFGLSPALYSEARYTLLTAGTAQIDNAAYADADSAMGTARAVIRDSARNRQRMNATVFGLKRIPRVGERVICNLSREGSTNDRDTTWMIRGVEQHGGNLKALRLALRRQVDPLFDRLRRVTR